jgi:hypothetical protein
MTQFRMDVSIIMADEFESQVAPRLGWKIIGHTESPDRRDCNRYDVEAEDCPAAYAGQLIEPFIQLDVDGKPSLLVWDFPS